MPGAKVIQVNNFAAAVGGGFGICFGICRFGARRFQLGDFGRQAMPILLRTARMGGVFGIAWEISHCRVLIICRVRRG